MRSSGRNSGSGSGGQGGRSGGPGGRPGGQGGGGRGQGGRSGGGSFRQGQGQGQGQGGGQGGRSGGQGGGGRGGSGQGGRSGGQGGQGGQGGRQGFQGGRDEQQDQRPRRPRPEERRYDVGNDAPGARGGQDGPRKGRGTAARGGAKGGPKSAQGGSGGGFRRGGSPSRPRELDAKIEQRNRDRYANKPDIQLPKTHPGAEQEGERLQKVLARAGMGSRRACEELIEQARVEVNGEIVVEQGMRVDVHKDEIKVDGLTVAAQSYLFFALNKPAGVVSSMEDPDGRQCLGDYVTNRETRLFHVGRLDTETEGIIMLTNHGELAHRLTHPKYGVKKTYLAAIQGPLPRDLGKRLKDGIQLEDGYARADHFRVVENTGKNYLVEVTLHEGRKHIVRRMLAEAGFPVERLVRTSFGPIPLGDQKSGWLRRLTNTEVGMLMREVGL
ncbi:pseudouridine synthase [Streptomyces globisporus]